MKNRFAPLKVQGINQIGLDIPGGFVFYITYYPRSNIDQLRTNINTEFHYRTVKMPLNYYAPITRLISWSINFNFYDLTLKNNAHLKYDTNNTNLFNIWATIITGEEAVKIRGKSSERPLYDPNTCVQGTFESAFGTLYINSSFVDNIFKGKEYPYIFFTIESSDNTLDITSIGVELSINSDLKTYGIKTVPEGVYLNGRLSYGEDNKVIYKLQCDKKRPYLEVEFSGISDLIKFTLSANAESEKNDEFENSAQKSEWGRELLIIKLDDNYFTKNDSIYLIIFANETNLDERLDYFVFKYSLGKSDEDFFPSINQSNYNVTYYIEGNSYNIWFYPIAIKDVSYFIKLVYKDDFIEGENINSIAISESKGKYKQIANPLSRINERLYYQLEAEKEVSYIKVMARFNLEEYKLFYLYTPVKITDGGSKPNPDKSDDKDKTDTTKNTDGKHDDEPISTGLVVTIAVSGVLLIIVIALIVLILMYNRKNKDLLNKVNKISFVESGARDRGDDSNLLLNDENELN